MIAWWEWRKRGGADKAVPDLISFFPDEPRAEVQTFVKQFRAKYQRDPDAFNAFAYDAVILAAEALKAGGTDRRAIRDALPKLHDVPSVVFGRATFDTNTRRVLGVRSVNVVVKDGKWALLERKSTVASQ